jgi:type VI secretion system secreted protein VgrG
MMTNANQVRVEVATDDSLDVRSFRLQQRMSQLFSVRVTAVSPNLAVRFEEVVGKDAGFSLATSDSAVDLRGLCIEMEQVKVDADGLATYTLEIAPRAWLLTQRKNYRVFQYMSELAIVQELLSEWGVPFETRTSQHRARKFRVQYDESDFTFMCRMLEDAGIAFYFEPSGGETTLILDDAPQTRQIQHPRVPFHDSVGVAPANFVTKVGAVQRVRPGVMTVGDLEYRRPSSAQPRLSAKGGLAQEGRLEQFDYEPGAFLFAHDSDGSSPSADDRGSSRTDEAEGARRVQARLHGKRSDSKRVRLESNILTLAPGSSLSVEHHPHRLLRDGLLVLEANVAGQHSDDWRVVVEATSTAHVYRPAPLTPKPVAKLESATVVGPKGEEIHTDEFGRVRVHFHWDRRSARDETSSCWLPTSQPWAGAGFGGVSLPRIGQEVFVEFLGGDPDRPVVIGRVYTELNPPPDKLPLYKEVSGIMSESTPRMVMGAADGGASGASSSLLGGGTPMSPGDINGAVTNQGLFQAQSPTGINHNWQGSGIKFNDRYGSELVYIQAQKDLHIVVNNCWRTVVGNNRACLVGTDDQLEVGNRYHTEIRANQTEEIGKNQMLTVKGSRGIDVRGKSEQHVGGDGIHVRATDEKMTIATRHYNRTVAIISDTKIALKVGSSSIVLTPGKITIDAAKVFLDPKQGKGAWGLGT